LQGLDSSQKAAYNLGSYSLGMAVAGIAVFVILVAGIVVLRRKNGARAQQNHGFVEIDQATAAASPEERHVANMQMNGYENPTYKYFESNA
jgi:amyloid beta A4 protein